MKQSILLDTVDLSEAPVGFPFAYPKTALWKIQCRTCLVIFMRTVDWSTVASILHDTPELCSACSSFRAYAVAYPWRTDKLRARYGPNGSMRCSKCATVMLHGKPKYSDRGTGCAECLVDDSMRYCGSCASYLVREIRATESMFGHRLEAWKLQDEQVGCRFCNPLFTCEDKENCGKICNGKVTLADCVAVAVT